MANEVIRSVCYFTREPNQQTAVKVKGLAGRLASQGYEIQTSRICAPLADSRELQSRVGDKSILLAVGTVPFAQALERLPNFYEAEEVSFNVDLTSTAINTEHTQPLFQIVKNKPGVTFNFTYVFNNRPS